MATENFFYDGGIVSVGVGVGAAITTTYPVFVAILLPITFAASRLTAHIPAALYV